MGGSEGSIVLSQAGSWTPRVSAAVHRETQQRRRQRGSEGSCVYAEVYTPENLLSQEAILSEGKTGAGCQLRAPNCKLIHPSKFFLSSLGQWTVNAARSLDYAPLTSEAQGRIFRHTHTCYIHSTQHCSKFEAVLGLFLSGISNSFWNWAQGSFTLPPRHIFPMELDPYMTCIE